MSQTEKNVMSIYEKKILRFIFGGIHKKMTCSEDQISSSLSYKESDIVNFIKVQRSKWTGHVVRMDEDRTTKKVFNAQPIGTWRKGMPNLKWINGLEKGLLVLKTENWRILAERKLSWENNKTGRKSNSIL
ncbi:uncharacterized protein TNCV_2061351 [Trichonephila clavipes]|nr:uncharacterized protein TNCV_2061351 [Trichonephila clavipes]